MANSTDFESFLKNINPSKSTIDEANRLHLALISQQGMNRDLTQLERGELHRNARCPLPIDKS